MVEEENTRIVKIAAQLCIEQGLELPEAKRMALRELNLSARTPLPAADLFEQEVQTRLRLFYPEQAAELRSLRELALAWMQKLLEFHPLIHGAVWQGWATRRHKIYLDLYCESSKDLEIWLVNQRTEYEIAHDGGDSEDRPTVRCLDMATRLHQMIAIYLSVHDRDAMRGALKVGHGHRPLRGSAAALQAVLL